MWYLKMINEKSCQAHFAPTKGILKKSLTFSSTKRHMAHIQKRFWHLSNHKTEGIARQTYSTIFPILKTPTSHR